MAKGRYKESIPFLKRAESEYPKNPSLLWNLGIANAAVAQHHDALEAWLRYMKAEPGDWKARAKVIQAYQALGDFKSRDLAITELYLSRKRGDDANLSKEKRFCREQFEIAGQRVFAFEYFEPEDPKKMFYRFSMVDPEGKEESYISLGSYKGTVDIARELGELKKSGELYHLDKYQERAHCTYAFFKSKPSYDIVRDDVAKVMRGEMKPVSSSLKGR